MGFITKPFKDADLHNNIQLAFSKFSKKTENEMPFETDTQHFFIKDKGVYQQIDLQDIVWIA